MKPADDSRPDEQLDAEAAAWLCEREEGFTAARAEAFAGWCAEPRQAAAVKRVEQTLILLDEMPWVRAPLERRVGRVEPRPAVVARNAERSWSSRAWLTALAAAVVVGLFGWWLAGRSPLDVEHFASDGASQRRVTLRDGSVVDLNAGSAIDVQWVAGERRLALRSGEAHFQVAPDKARPFIVAAGGISVRAVGTAFQVQLAAAAVAVVVTEGTVSVQRVAAAASSRSQVDVSPAAVLTVNERTVVPVTPAGEADVPAAPQVERVSAEQLRALLAWQDPVVTFNDTPLRDVVMQFNRRNQTQLTLGERELGERRIGGVIALDQVEALVRLLEQDGEIVSSPRGAHEIVLHRVR